MIPFGYKLRTLAAEIIDLREKYPFEEYVEVAVADTRPEIGISNFKLLACLYDTVYLFHIKGKPKFVCYSGSYSAPLYTLYKVTQVVYKNRL